MSAPPHLSRLEILTEVEDIRAELETALNGDDDRQYAAERTERRLFELQQRATPGAGWTR